VLIPFLAKKAKKTEETRVLSAKNLFNKAKGIAAKTRQLIIDTRINEKNSKKQGK